MQWLRDRPGQADELDQVDNEGRWKTGAVPRDVMESGDYMDQDRPEGRTGTLFDDEDEEEDGEEEEEEEDAPAQAAGGAKPKQSPPKKPQSQGSGLATGSSSTPGQRATPGTGLHGRPTERDPMVVKVGGPRR